MPLIKLRPISFAGEPPSHRRLCRTTTSSTRSSPFLRTAAGMPPWPGWCFTSPPATALPLSTVAGGGRFPGTVFPLELSPRLEVPFKALCRERIFERMRVLKELVPIFHKVLSMSRLSGAGAVAQVVADIPLSSVEGKVSEGGGKNLVWEEWPNNGIEEQVVKLMEDVGTAMQFLQSGALCIIPISITTTIHQFHHQNEIPAAKLEPNAPS